MPRRKREWKRKAKEARKKNKMWAEGARESIMRPHLEAYADALARGRRAEHDYLQKVCNEFHVRISWRLADHEEPELPLPPYDAFAPPVPEAVTDEEHVQRLQRQEELNTASVTESSGGSSTRARSLRGPSISVSKLRDNPYAILLGKLTGLSSPPKARQGYQQFMCESPTVVADAVTERWNAVMGEDGSVNTKKPNGPFRCKVAMDLFKDLPDSEQAAIKARAVSEAKVAKDVYAAGMKNGPLKTPQARQECIDNVGRFLAPILRAVREYTGLQSFVVLGGPMPKYGGEIGTLHLSCGTNLAAVSTGFPAWDKPRWGKDVTGFYMQYLRTAFTSEECAEAALPVASSTLDDALFKMAPESDSDGTISGSDSDSDSDSGSDSGSEASDEEEGKKKKAKKAEKAKSKEKGKAVVSTAGGKKRKSADGSGGRVGKKQKTAEKEKAVDECREDEEEERPKTAEEIEAALHLAQGREYREARERQMAKNKELLDALKLRGSATAEAFGFAPPKLPAAPKTRQKAVAAPTGPPRRSRRNIQNDGEGDDGADGDDEEDIEMEDATGAGGSMGGGEGSSSTSAPGSGVQPDPASMSIDPPIVDPLAAQVVPPVNAARTDAPIDPPADAPIKPPTNAPIDPPADAPIDPVVIRTAVPLGEYLGSQSGWFVL
ncbi:hypothetical protein C8F04DRAFT_1256076 [Mycena alexandri]|uniref:Uncharacterized protein n=1 Tax=Mycena alexandri TaxID=1745969 RepID=A0AAD6T369_9AGAR|nr:hypothetical protein C8F04DRAFT_1256076 [Mycena alexandri]